MELTKTQEKELLTIAKKALSYYLASNLVLKDKPKDEKFLEKKGIFLTIKKDNETIGSMGHPFPSLSIWEGIIDSAINAGFKNKNPLKANDLDKINIQISIIENMKEIKGKPEEIKEKIKEKGVLIKKGNYIGICLPNYKGEKIENATINSGLPKYAWKQENVKKYIFETIEINKGE